LAERSSRRRLAAEDRGGLPLSFCFFHWRLAVGELHCTRSPELAPGYSHRSAIGRLSTLKCLGIVGGPHIQRDWIRQRRLQRDAHPLRPLRRRAPFFKADDGRGIANAHIEEGRNFPPGVQVRRDCGCLAVGYDRPGELLSPEILRHRYSENAPLPSR